MAYSHAASVPAIYIPEGADPIAYTHEVSGPDPTVADRKPIGTRGPVRKPTETSCAVHKPSVMRYLVRIRTDPSVVTSPDHYSREMSGPEKYRHGEAC